ncbi:MAG: hypothetical protein J1F12_08115 [Muribaculaceae bacterium]|nr:hypothetical protein [Muribaculaceae bacterium]
MDNEELKRKLMGLWEKTTHNSKDLLSILFDYYFDDRYLEYKELEGRVVSALFGIPYEFGCGEKKLSGLYLISLSSEEGYRKKGILAELLQTVNNRFAKQFDFTFIVPHTELLADYFGTQGYFNSFFIMEERYTPFHDFRNDYLITLTDSDERIRSLKIHLLEEIKVIDNTEKKFPHSQIIKFIEKIESKSRSSVNLRHTYKDLEYLLHENSLGNLNFYISYDTDGKITGVIFTKKEDLKRVKILASYVADSCSYYAILEFIKHQLPDESFTIIKSDYKQPTSQAIIRQTYASANPSGIDLDNTFETVELPFNYNKLLQPLGMARLLRFENILKYIAETRSDVEFKLHIRDYNEEVSKGINSNEVVFVVKSGKLNIEPLKDFYNDRSLLHLSVKEISELLLRKNDSSNLIMEAFGIPRLDLQYKLLPF